MQTLSKVQQRWRQPRDLAALIELYESNYWRMYRLAPDLDELSVPVVSSVAGAQDLFLTVVERHKYTTTVVLTYGFVDDDSVVLEPNARICLYHDVRAAELLGHSRRRRLRAVLPWRRGHMPELDRKWTMNRFLHKWLKFCTHQGHIFLSATSRAAPNDVTVD